MKVKRKNLKQSFEKCNFRPWKPIFNDVADIENKLRSSKIITKQKGLTSLSKKRRAELYILQSDQSILEPPPKNASKEMLRSYINQCQTLLKVLDFLH